MATGHHVGDKIKWKWGDRWRRGTVKGRFTQKTTRTIEGTEVTRSTVEDEPARLIEQSDGDRVLKSRLAVQKAG